MPRGTRRHQPLAMPVSPAPLQAADPASPAPPRRTNKKRTVAENAIAIDSLHSKIETMSALLTQVVGAAQAPKYDHEESFMSQSPTRDTQPRGMRATGHPQRSRHRSDTLNSELPPRQRFNSASHLASSTQWPASRLHASHGSYRDSPVDPLGDRTTGLSRRQLPSTLQELDESVELQDRVAHIVSAALALSHLSGKRSYPHSFVRRGTKKSKTTLGDLTLPEYNMGFIRLMNSREVDPADRPYMFQHLEHVNEDAISYPFADVRAWSEDICFTIAEGDMTWDDHYKIDLLRIKMSQNGPAGRTQGPDRRDSSRRVVDAGALDPHSEMSPEVLAARPGPPCRPYNNGSCYHKSHHVSNGFRQLHVCSSCVYHKCSLIPHPEKECKSKEYRKRQSAKDPEPGFGK